MAHIAIEAERWYLHPFKIDNEPPPDFKKKIEGFKTEIRNVRENNRNITN